MTDQTDAARDKGQTLKELIADRKGRRTYYDLAEAAGGTPGASRWQQLATNDLRDGSISGSVPAIARALRVPEREVWDAVGRSLGIQVDDSDTNPLLSLFPAPWKLELLPRGMRVAIAEVVHGAVDAYVALSTGSGKTATATAIAASVAAGDDEADGEATVRPIRRAARTSTGSEGRGTRKNPAT